MQLPPSSQPTGLEISLDALLRQSPAYDLVESAIAVCDAHGAVRYSNPAFRNLNLSVRDTPENFSLHGSLLECPECLNWIKNAVVSGGNATFSRTFYYSPLITVNLSLCIKPLVNADGLAQGGLLAVGEESIQFEHRHLARMQESNLDLIERIRILSREKLSNERLVRLLLKEAPFAMILMNEKRTIIQANHAAETLFQTTAVEMIGHSCDIFLHCYDECACCPVIELNRHIKAAELTGVTAQKQSLPLLRSVSAVHGDSGVVLVEAFINLSEIKAAERMIKELAFFDTLTKLPNRRLLQDRLQHAIASSVRGGKEGALLFIDLDNFKTLNDTLGHDIGDLLLEQVAERLVSCVREGDTVARLGGDEFVIMLENLSESTLEAAEQTETVGEKILDRLNQPYQLGTYAYNNTPSIGATLFNNNKSIDELLKQADIAMYQAKKAGRNTLRFFDPDMQESINIRAALESDLRRAIVEHQFRLHYQIQVDNLRRPIGAEALIRWIHPERGIVFPEQFIPLAEESELILSIGHWVLEAACAQLEAWKQHGNAVGIVLSVNVSAKQFRQADFVAHVHSLVRRHSINPRLLKLELTESMLLENIEGTIATMNALNGIGIQLSLDDFGTGYSSLQYIKRLPLSQLKIDQSFVRDIALDNSDKAIVRTIIAMAHSLLLDVIAEGVETEDQIDFLEEAGCVHYQGYLFGKPVPIEQFEAAFEQFSMPTYCNAELS